MAVHLYVICCFSLAAFSILSLSLIFVILITMCLVVFLFRLILYGTLCFLDWGPVSFPQLGNFSAIIASNIFLGHFSLSGSPIMQILVFLMLFQRSLKLSLFLFILFNFFYSVAVITTGLSSSSLIRSCLLVYHLVYYYFLLVYFSFQLLGALSLFVLYIF